MIAPLKLHPWTAVLIFILINGCTDRRRPKFSPQQFPENPESALDLVADVQFLGKDTQVLQMTIQGSSLYLTGRPFGFSRWDIGSSPEDPKIIFAASNSIDAFSPFPKFGFWTPDNFAQGALAVSGKTGLMSGAAGVSQIDLAEGQNPVEVARFPAEKIDGVQVTRDPNFVYGAMVAHPNLPLVYGFKEQDHVYTLSVAALGLTIREKAAYGPQGVCCAMGAAILGSNVLVAMRGNLWTFDLGADGRLGSGSQIDELQAVNVVTTSNYIYVQHEAGSLRSSEAQSPSGIYVFDSQGQPVTFLPVSPRRFAVFQDTYLYANMDDARVSIFAIR